jgi:phosphoribosylglycinamide formyltransferase-1
MSKSGPRDAETIRTVGIITYDHCHLKTEQLVHRLLQTRQRSRPVFDMTIYALPFKPRPERRVLTSHRPDQFDAVHTRELARANGVRFVLCDVNRPLENCDVFLIGGAGLLPAGFIGRNKIVNAHPGLVPAVRGLDAFKWAIYEGLPLGVSLHFIDERVDSGEPICTVPTPVYRNDTLSALARRHYELEVDILADFEYQLAHGRVECYPSREPHKRMPIELEAELAKRFEAYKDQFAKPDSESA